jgi:DNA-directed RNA polymerase subunit RPC12/RpoP
VEEEGRGLGGGDKMVEIECLACGKPVKMPQYIDTEKYDGQVVCQECKSLLHVKLVKGKVRKSAEV